MLSIALALALAPDAHACKGPTHQTSCHIEKLEEELEGESRQSTKKKKKKKHIDLALGAEGTGLPHAPTSGAFLDLSGQDAYLRLEGRLSTDLRHQARISSGVTLLDRDPFEVRLGLFLGNVGVFQDLSYSQLAVGTDVSVGVHFNRISGTARWVGGKRRTAQGVWHETDLSIAYRVLGQIRVHGHLLRMDAGPGHRMSGVGLGGSITF